MADRKCEICGKKINVKEESLGRNGTGKTKYLFSEEGVCFLNWGWFWFCNDCWDKIIEHKTKWKNKK